MQTLEEIKYPNPQEAIQFVPNKYGVAGVAQQKVEAKLYPDVQLEQEFAKDEVQIEHPV